MKQASALTHERGHASPQIVTSDGYMAMSGVRDVATLKMKCLYEEPVFVHAHDVVRQCGVHFPSSCVCNNGVCCNEAFCSDRSCINMTCPKLLQNFIMKPYISL